MEWRRAALGTGGFRAFDFQIDHDGILTTSNHHSFTWFVAASVNLLVRHVGRNIDEIAGPASPLNSRRSPHRMRARPRTI